MPSPLRSESTLKSSRIVLGVIIVALLIAGLFVAALGYLYFQPRRYYSQATIEIRPTPAETSDPGFPAADIESLRGPEVLDLVVKMLKLTESYGEKGGPLTAEEARGKVLRSLELRMVKNTPNLVTIGVYDRDPLRAATIANTIVVTYRHYRMDQLDYLKAKGLKIDDDFQPITIREKAVPAPAPLPWWQR